MITIENVENKIYLFGRNDREAFIKKDSNFRPYFYYEDDSGEYKTIDGGRAKKIVLDKPKEVPIVREDYDHCEADIVYVNRYIIDKIEKIEKSEIRICYIDIEIKRTERGYESPQVARNPILAICCFDSFEREYWQVCLNKTHQDEKEMMKDFIKYVREKDPDMLIAWSGDNFDFPFIINRLRKLRLNPNKLSRLNGKAYVAKYGVRVFGRVLFDLMHGYRKMNPGGRESWALDYISKYEKLGGKENIANIDDFLRKSQV